MAQYLLDRQIPFTAFDSDRNNPDCWRCYQKILPVNLAILSESTRYEDAANGIFNAGIEQRTLVNLPAQVYQPLKEWFEKNELLSLAPDVGVSFVFWFVTDAGYDSLQLLEKSLQHYKDRVRFILVRNHGRTDDFEALERNESLQTLLKTFKIPSMDFPCLIGSVIRNRIDSESLTFGEALSREDFGIIDKQRVRKFLREAYQAFEETGALA
jgi:hypothetical protein